MSEEYSNHREQLESVMGLEGRMEFLQEALMDAFQEHLFTEEVIFINFGEMTADELASAFVKYPIIIKSVLTSINVASRAIERDLEISTFDTYARKITPTRAGIIAGYIKPMLPPTLSIPALCELDRYCYVDKEMRASKGRWEELVTQYLNDNATVQFVKRKFVWNDEKFEIDAASPTTGDIKIAIDVKRIESKKDIHKRADEIVNKAVKFKDVFCDNGSQFFAIIYYPFPNDHLSITERLEDDSIDGVYFASKVLSTIEQQAKFVLGKAKVLKPKDEDLEDESDSM